MKLMTQELVKRFAQVGSQDGVSDPVIIAHYFNPTGAGDWYATEYDPKDRIIFGYVSIFRDWNDEWGYTTLNELEVIKGKFGFGIERDLYWAEKRASEVIAGFKGFGALTFTALALFLGSGRGKGFNRLDLFKRGQD